MCPLGGMVDTADLKSAGPRPCWFESGSGYFLFFFYFVVLLFQVFKYQDIRK